MGLVDRGHRELPIRLDYVGKNVPTQPHELVRMSGQGGEYSDDILLLAIADLERLAADAAPSETE